MQSLDPREHGCARPRARRKTRCLSGVLCILTGILVLVCFAPSWLVALIVSFVLFATGAVLIGFP